MSAGGSSAAPERGCVPAGGSGAEGDSLLIREVGPRDGLQPEEPLPVATRVRLVEDLVAAGVKAIEAVAFVSPKAVPQMAGAAEVMAGVQRVAGVQYLALVPNAKGAELALAAGVDGLSLTVSASEEYSQRNVNMSVEQSLEQVAAVRSVVGDDLPMDTVISCSFGSPYEGGIAPAAAAALGRRALATGSSTVTYADTTGMATPRRMEELLAQTGVDVGLHLHDTRGTALVNAYAAFQAGVRRFDTAIGGLGGSPFAKGAGGNLATEDLVHLCRDLGVETGIDLQALLATAVRLGDTVGHAVPSRLAAMGPR